MCGVFRPQRLPRPERDKVSPAPRLLLSAGPLIRASGKPQSSSCLEGLFSLQLAQSLESPFIVSSSPCFVNRAGDKRSQHTLVSGEGAGPAASWLGRDPPGQVCGRKEHPSAGPSLSRVNKRFSGKHSPLDPQPFFLTQPFTRISTSSCYK